MLEHPDGYVVFVYCPGPRELRDLQAISTHTGHLLVCNAWYRILGDQRLVTPLTPEESAWVVAFWQCHTAQHPRHLWAVVLADDVVAHLVPTQLKREMRYANRSYQPFAAEQETAAWLTQQ